MILIKLGLRTPAPEATVTQPHPEIGIQGRIIRVTKSMKWKSFSRVWLFATPWTPWNSPGRDTGVGSRSLLQGIFPTQGLNPCLPHCKWMFYPLSQQGSPLSSGNVLVWDKWRCGVSFLKTSLLAGMFQKASLGLNSVIHTSSYCQTGEK